MKIITAVVNNPLYIVIQYYTLKKFFQHEYEFIVFNDAKDFPDYTNFNDITIKKEIEETCKNLNIKCINIPNDHHKILLDSSTRVSNSMNFMLKFQMLNPDKYLIIDSDMFLIDYFNPEKYFDYDCAIILQSRQNNKINYMWNGFVYFDMHKLKNISLLNWDCCEHCDTGGKMKDWISYWLLENNKHRLYTPEHIRYIETENIPVDNLLLIRNLWSKTWDESELPSNLSNNTDLKEFLKNDTRNINNKYFCEIYDNCFLHIRASGNWMKEERIKHIDYTQRLLNFIVKLLDCNMSL